VQQKKNAQLLWNEAWNEYTKDVDLSTLRVGGRATKEHPNKEDASFWLKSKDQSGYNRMSNGESSTRTGRFGRRLKALLRLR
jgi:hypothetical protein